MSISPSRKVRSVGVVGSGTMGSGLAEVALRAGYDVVLRSRTRDAAETVRCTLRLRLDRDVARQKLRREERDDIVGRFRTTTMLADLAGCDLVIESVTEDLAIKQRLFSELDELMDPAAILATNTSTLPVIDIARATNRPEKICGIHFFNPVHSMRLVEVVRPLVANDDTVTTAVEFARSCGKDAIVVEDTAGFVVNALLFPYLNNAIRMWERGTASMEAIDTAMCGGCNFPMGPFALLDLVGLDTSLAILDALHAEFRDPNYAACATMRRKVSAGHLGRKSGLGFYTYECTDRLTATA
ncbi:MAG TPA: 3-hydroxybutyryl-CoA dehydrogenase [Ilumatobacteraceae bacterium]